MPTSEMRAELLKRKTVELAELISSTLADYDHDDLTNGHKLPIPLFCGFIKEDYGSRGWLATSVILCGLTYFEYFRGKVDETTIKEINKQMKRLAKDLSKMTNLKGDGNA